MTIVVTDSNFRQEVLEADIPIMVDICTEWSMPCKIVESIVDEIEHDYEGKLKLCRLDADEAGQIASQYQVMSIPTLAIFKNGKLVDRIIGVLPKDVILEKINPHIEKEGNYANLCLCLQRMR